MISGKRILITGGAGFLGKKIIERYYSENDIVVYSRDEAKHYMLKKQYPKVNFAIGDIYDYESLNEASKGVDIGIFAASMKQIESCEENPLQAIRTIGLGAINSKKAAIENNFESAVFISSDKACSATTIYGACKYVAEQAFLDEKNHSLNSCRYGNVMNSTGSIFPVIADAIKNDRNLTLFGESMTRFLIHTDEAIDLIEFALRDKGCGVYIPKLKSVKIKDIFEIYKENFGLRFEVGIPRPNEKIHELLFSSEESPRMIDKGKYQIISKNQSNNGAQECYSSDRFLMDKKEVYNTLEKHGFFL